ncbi:DnaJ-domain-containing protein [Xylona heveae TC161]|uniref:DnaJ-domain-containing protein n=1 Tax=Xylona heveae (strain CBS 132557 / TC161) TaxID=1328760 RepID=A0A165GWF3_XYLHT|nr:DnaJ-domain-containing protein [Xylona heveae TC161]KZF22683.1 DnaJ-domain-containing protein [Xylona heveae TC161]
MSAIQINLPLPLLPAGWSSDKDFKAVGSLSPATQRSLEPVGPHFLAHARRKRHQRTFSEDERIQAQENVKKVEEDDADDLSEPEDPVMLQRDPKDWKNQDHYAVLGLSKYRYRATEEQIKRAHRKKVLKHHPDKKAAAGTADDDSFFKCIQKATEVLTDPVKRRQYDSVDEHADVEPPSKKETQKGNFFKLWAPVFDSEARFSKNHPVPSLGNENSTREEVETFYNFWYNFDSWRTFEYQDEDVPDDNENRDQKRHVERKNNAARKKKKTEDTTRLRHLVDEALALDERIKKFRKEERAHKDKRRLEKEAEQKRLAEEAARAKEEETRLKAEKEAAEKLQKAEDKKTREAAKNAAKKNKRVLKSAVKDNNYLHEGGDAPAAQVDRVLTDVDLIIAKLEATELADLAGKLSSKKGATEVKAVYAEEVKRLVEGGKLKEGEAASLAA